MTNHEAHTEPHEDTVPSEDTEPSVEQIDLIRRVLAPHIHRARAERTEHQSAA
ncbi:hypothetical protein [Streptomyces nigrescens]|uniref:Uncharacterized protein n=1 Tax=Streptomyces nigrescens TaxID=1920 RepID=A0ABY7JEZ2_STRNI|nr:hypothetical protein [Streptomyces nigrescens]WAU09958.1 hypothetical protein STRNI_008243 [Streptomyces nigrescens]